MKTGYLNYIHYFRGFSIILIIAIHCRNSFSWEFHRYEQKVWISLLDNATILFVFIAGFLFQYLNSSKFDFLKYFRRKLKFVMLPYLIVSIPAIIANLISQEIQPWIPESIQDSMVLQVLYMILTGKHLGPLWFMPMIFVFYVISPLLIKLDNKYFYFGVFPILFVAGLFTFRFGYFSNTWHSFVYFLPIYFFGMFASHYHEDILNMRNKLFIPLTMIFLTITLLHIEDIIEVPRLTSFQSAETLPIFAFNFTKLKMSLLSIILILAFYYMRKRSFPALNKLGDLSFGIYFIHMYLIILLRYFIVYFIPDFSFSTLTFLVFTTIIMIWSYYSIRIAKWMFKEKSRMLIGS